MVSVRIICPVNLSEDPEKVLNAILGIFQNAKLEFSERGYEGTASTPEGFGMAIRRQGILNAASSILLKNLHGDTICMNIDKQVITVGKVSFTYENPVLGAIEVTMTGDGEEVKA